MKQFDNRVQSLIRRFKEGSALPEHTLLSVLDDKCDVELGRLLHCVITISEPRSALTGNCLIRLFSCTKSLLEANLVFCQLFQPTIHSWQAIISAHHLSSESYEAFHLYAAMVVNGTTPNSFVFSCVLGICGNTGNLNEGMLIHDHAVENGLESDVFVGSSLIDMYGKCLDVDNAQRVFDKLGKRNLVSWNTIISSYVQSGLGSNALQLFGQMQANSGTLPNEVTFLSALKACSQIRDIKKGLDMHGQIVKIGLDSVVSVGNTLIDMYSKFGLLEEAVSILFCLQNRNVVSWSSIIASFAQHGYGSLALQLYEQMQRESIHPDRVAYMTLLNACTHTKTLELGKAIHGQIIEKGFDIDVTIRGVIINMYVKLNMIREAQAVFDEISDPSIVLWGTMISGYTNHGQGLTALELYRKMQGSNVKPDNHLFSCLLKACSYLGALEEGKTMSQQMIEYGLEPDTAVGNALINMYMKCGDINEAGRVFGKLSTRDEVSWSLIICINSFCGNGKLPVTWLKDMQREGVVMDETMFARLFSFYSHTGLIEDGQSQLNSIIERECLSLNSKHFTCVLDLLGSTGNLEDAKNVLETMPFSPNIISWASLLKGCRQHGNLKLGQNCLKQIVKHDPYSASGYVLLSKLYSETGMSDNENIQYTRGVQKLDFAIK